jgi:hypothetical protein
VKVTKCGTETISTSVGGPKAYNLGHNVYTAGFYIQMADDEDGFKKWFNV